MRLALCVDRGLCRFTGPLEELECALLLINIAASVGFVRSVPSRWRRRAMAVILLLISSACAVAFARPRHRLLSRPTLRRAGVLQRGIEMRLSQLEWRRIDEARLLAEKRALRRQYGACGQWNANDAQRTNTAWRRSCNAGQLDFAPRASATHHSHLADDLWRSHASSDLVFVGDSMIRQTFLNFACSSRLQVRTTHWVRSKWRGRHRMNLKLGGSLAFFWANSDPADLPQDVLLNATQPSRALVIILGVGSWFEGQRMVTDVLRAWHRWFLAIRSRRGGAAAPTTLIYQEYFAPHFPTGYSDFEPLPNLLLDKRRGLPSEAAASQAVTALPTPTNASLLAGYPCQPMKLRAFLHSKASFRLTSANAFFRSKGVPILPTFEASMRAYRQHTGRNHDCRHFCDDSPVLDYITVSLQQMLLNESLLLGAQARAALEQWKMSRGRPTTVVSSPVVARRGRDHRHSL